MQPVDWSKCVFCETYKHKGDTSLSQILTYTAEHNLKEAVKVRSDIQMLRKINGVDLIAQEMNTMQVVFLLTRVKEIWINFGMMIMIPSQDTLKPFQSLYKKLMLIFFI